jgi:hypothetical protein
VRFGANAWHNFFYAAVVVANDLRFGGVEVHRAAGATVLEQGAINLVQMQQVWHRFVEWWCLPSPDGADGLAGLDLGAELNGDARFYAFELACLMNEMEQIKAFTCGR